MSTLAVAVKAAIKAGIDSLPSLAQYQRIWGSGDVEYISIMLGDITWDDTAWETNRGQNEEFRITVFIVVNLLRGDGQSVDLKTTEVAGAVQDWVKQNPGLNTPGVITSAWKPQSLRSGQADQNYQAIYEAEIWVKARI